MLGLGINLIKAIKIFNNTPVGYQTFRALTPDETTHEQFFVVKLDESGNEEFNVRVES